MNNICESSIDLMMCANVPEVVGTIDEITCCGFIPKQSEFTKNQKCEDEWYSLLQWLKNWQEAIPDTVENESKDEQRDEYVKAIERGLLMMR